MLRRHVLAALDVGVAAGSDDAARGALADIDWVLRGPARRRLEAALLDAAVATGVTSYDDPEAVRHVLRAAALIVRAQPEVQLGDRARVAAAYGAAAISAPLRLPLATIVVGLLALATATTFGAATVLAIQAPVVADVYERPPAPPPVGVFRTGGVPKHDPAIEHVLAEEFPTLATAGAHEVVALRDHRAFMAHGPGLAIAWRDMIMSFERWMYAGGLARDAASRELRERIDGVSDQLAAAQLGYYLDPQLELDGRVIFSYRIEEVAFVRGNDARIRVLSARRIDHLERGARVLGMKTEEVEDPVVLMDTVEAKVAGQILPVLGGRPYPLADDGWAYSQRAREASGAAGVAIRRELLAALYTDAGNAERAAVRCKELLVGSVRHHEAQHRLDQDRGLAHPDALAQMLSARRNDPFSVRARFELSAYLSQIASDVWLPQLTLWNLARHGFRRGQVRREESFVAVLVIERLAAKLGVASDGPVIHGGEIDRDRLARLVPPLAQKTTVELRSAAAAVWKDLYGAPLVRLYDEPDLTH